MAELARRSIRKKGEFYQAAKELVARTRAAQGIPDTVTDVEVLHQIATLIKQGAA
jgi:hypothetical protein